MQIIFTASKIFSFPNVIIFISTMFGKAKSLQVQVHFTSVLVPQQLLVEFQH